MEPLVTVIASSYLSKDSLLQMVCNFRLQTRQDFILEIVHDGYNEELRNFIKPFLAENMVWNEVDGPNGRGNFVGRNLILDKVTTPYVMFASDDNYYTPTLFDSIIPHLKKNLCDMLIFRCLHNSVDYIYDRFKHNGVPYVGGIDLCQFVVKTEIVKSVGKFKNFTEDSEFKMGTEDGDLVVRMLESRNMNIGLIDNCLLVHN